VALANELGLIPDTVSRAYLPRLSRDANARETLTPKVFRMTLAACLLMSVVVIAASPFMLRLLYGEDFAQSIQPFMLLVPGILFFGSTRVLGVYFWAKKKPQYGLASNWVAFVTTTVVTIFLVSRIGMLGAAAGKSAGQIVLGLMTIMWFRKESGKPLRELVPTVKDVRDLYTMTMGIITRRKKPLSLDGNMAEPSIDSAADISGGLQQTAASPADRDSQG
jgi:O-antigen/teichoic acid export membrane protein